MMARSRALSSASILLLTGAALLAGCTRGEDEAAPIGGAGEQVVASGLLAGLAGTLNAARLGSGVTILGAGLELDAIAAVVIGGTLLIGGAGTISGTLCGVLLLGVIQNVINQIGTLDSSYQLVTSGAFLAVVVVVQTYLSRTQRLH